MSKIKNKGWSVAISGIGIKLILGFLYTWSIIKLNIAESINASGRFNWDLSKLNDPYALSCLTNALGMIIGGRLQDKLNPKITAITGGVLGGIGLIICGQSCSYNSWILGFGLFTGAGIGIAYSSILPPALKWFPAEKTGFISGLIVAGFGLAAVYIAPLVSISIKYLGLPNTMSISGIVWIIIVCSLSSFLVNPPAGYNPNVDQGTNKQHKNILNKDSKPTEMLRTKNFYLLWFTYMIGSGVGLMFISNVADLAKASMAQWAWVLVTVVAIGNTGGRFFAGVLSDKIGRTKTMAIMLSFQAFIMLSLLITQTNQASLLLIITVFAGLNYGSNLSLFPAATRDLFGLKHFGINYGLLFSAWGIGGLLLPRISQMSKAYTGSFNAAYLVCVILLGISVILALKVKNKKTN